MNGLLKKNENTNELNRFERRKLEGNNRNRGQI